MSVDAITAAVYVVDDCVAGEVEQSCKPTK